MSDRLTTQYLEQVTKHMKKLHDEEGESILKAARMVADQIKEDRLVYAYGPGGHSNLGSQELFFRAGGLMHVSAILDEGTLLSSGALRSMAIERTPGYSSIVMDEYGLQQGDLLIIINAYGINSATIDAALEAKKRSIRTIGVTSRSHADETPADHPARHPSKKNLYELVDVVLDSSTFANSFLLNAMAAEAIGMLAKDGVTPPIWKSGNASGGDEWNGQFIERFKGKIKKL
ncbi:sugar isomerase domain-containing protein [Fictibacillus enclensis]|uniref:sugar isomerase domain-containing protein n=1 Tax=Fictibacillus enclensis TaxID=1017270 RepID=UPI0024BFEA78|nr:sugar isomerase domain-containing protein [Fictibacillus enclensis]WHY71956.1 sugar isomerase domain-containing protein [Fictibacillus enclensis]